MITNTILAAVTFIQIVTNWGPVTKGGMWPNFDGTYAFVEHVVNDAYQQVGNVESQEVLRITLPDEAVVTNVLKSTLIRTITKRGKIPQTIIWDSTNEADVVRRDVWDITNTLSTTNNIYWSNTNVVFMSNTTWTASLVGTMSNSVAINDLVIMVKRSKMSTWEKIKEWWRKK